MYNQFVHMIIYIATNSNLLPGFSLSAALLFSLLYQRTRKKHKNLNGKFQLYVGWAFVFVRMKMQGKSYYANRVWHIEF